MPGTTLSIPGPGSVMRRLLAVPSRSDRTEILDAEGHDPAELAANFRDIQRVNGLLGGTSTILRHLPRLLAAIPDGQPVTVLDLATGSADIPLAISRWANRQGRDITIVASDSSEPILTLAREQTRNHPDITVINYDALAVPLPDGQFDIVLCSLSLHHFAPDDAVQVLREMDRLARTGFILNDLRRGRLGYAAAWIASRLTTRNRLTRHDAPLSVLRAYTPSELEALLGRAGINDAVISTHLWFRMAAVSTKAIPHG
ncbi:MAG: methyltransferase domain-containing protein [Chloroflexia bacterium]|nr:methyltransferase domain-containing protein [Chloroflexia bacterium]